MQEEIDDLKKQIQDLKDFIVLNNNASSGHLVMRKYSIRGNVIDLKDHLSIDYYGIYKINLIVDSKISAAYWFSFGTNEYSIIFDSKELVFDPKNKKITLKNATEKSTHKVQIWIGR
jgi:hypothetical protein